MFYDRFKQLCDAKGISVTRATEEIGLARTIEESQKAVWGRILKRIEIDHDGNIFLIPN